MQEAVSAWGSRQLAVLEAEDRLSYACEKGVTEDPVLLALREAFQVRCQGLCGMGTVL
jgi:preprotein translocase subunit SecA